MLVLVIRGRFREEYGLALDLRQAAPRYSGSFDDEDGKSRRNRSGGPPGVVMNLLAGQVLAIALIISHR